MKPAGRLLLVVTALCAITIAFTQHAGVEAATAGGPAPVDDTLATSQVLCPMDISEFKRQVNDERGCKFIAGAGSALTPTVKLKALGNFTYGAPLRMWDGNAFVNVGKAAGHGWYSCHQLMPGEQPRDICALYDNLNVTLRSIKPLVDWLFVGAARKGSKIRSRSLAGAGHLSKFWPAILHRVCIKLQLQSAYIPSTGKRETGPPEDKYNTEGDDRRAGWCVYARVSQFS
eukprot:jgi/Mesvir1/25578/Mv01809-RA.1